MFPNIYREMAARNRMTAKDLSTVLGINEKTLRNKLRGKTEFTHKEMLKIQQLFGGTLDELFRSVDEPA